MASETYQAKYKRASEIRLGGAIGNLQEGIELETHGVTTRLIAWPGNGFQTEAVHVLTVHAGQESTAYSYDVSEEAMLCLAGEGEVYLHGSWRAFRPGDLAYFPEGVSHAVRNLRGTDDVIVVTQITPPQLDLYETGGFYHRAQGTWNEQAIFKATINARGRELPSSQMTLHETEAEVRAQHLSKEEVRRAGALFNVYLGNNFEALGLPGRYILWPPSGTRQAGFNYVFAPAHTADPLHAHPISDECLVVWEGMCQGIMAPGYSAGDWMDLDTYDVMLAPCGVLHGHRSLHTPSVMGGFASPPQPDLHLTTTYLEDGVFRQGDYERLEDDAVEGIAELRASRLHEGSGQVRP
jgi:mannose-6-phosphate isomerase-like protein (cupin superfamily)